MLSSTRALLLSLLFLAALAVTLGTSCLACEDCNIEVTIVSVDCDTVSGDGFNSYAVAGSTYMVCGTSESPSTCDDEVTWVGSMVTYTSSDCKSGVYEIFMLTDEVCTD